MRAQVICWPRKAVSTELKCIFTGRDADSDEHVIPRWLQTRFGLSEQTMVIPNGTTLKYKFHRVPATTEANKHFGAIENRISRGVFDPAEIYLWALKIHIGCIYRDASLRFDIRDKSSPFILDVSDFEQEVWLFQLLFNNWSNGGTTTPSPFGSVFILDSLSATPNFDFMHCLITGVVGIDIGGKFILVFLWDQGDAKDANILDQWEKWHSPRVKALAGAHDFNDNCYLAPHVCACESAYWVYRHRRPYSMVKTPGQITLIPPSGRPSCRPFQEDEYRRVCRNYGLDLFHCNGETKNTYRPLKDLTGRDTEAASTVGDQNPI
jgi:hypothetical protein